MIMGAKKIYWASQMKPNDWDSGTKENQLDNQLEPSESCILVN